MKIGLVFLAACLIFEPGLRAATVTHAPWGQDAAGAPVEMYTITSAKAEVKITTYGARIVSIRVPNRSGAMGDVVLGQDSVQGYTRGNGAFMGATIGRYANRIDKGEFTLNGTTYHIPTGQGGVALHGGTAGFHTKTFTAKEIPDGVEMTLNSPDGDMGFPGALTLHVRFTLTEFHGDPALKIEYMATTDKPTVVNFTNHSYFNLGDDSSTPVFDDLARINADSYTPFDKRAIPTGEIAPVAGTPYDFRTMHKISDQVPERGYDNDFVLRSSGLKTVAAEVEDPASGRTIRVYTTEPALQFYVPKFPAPPAGAPAAFRRFATQSFSLETQHYPDSPNHANFPSTVLNPGKKFDSTTIFVFGVMKGAASK